MKANYVYLCIQKRREKIAIETRFHPTHKWCGISRYARLTLPFIGNEDLPFRARDNEETLDMELTTVLK